MTSAEVWPTAEMPATNVEHDTDDGLATPSPWSPPSGRSRAGAGTRPASTGTDGAPANPAGPSAVAGRDTSAATTPRENAPSAILPSAGSVSSPTATVAPASSAGLPADIPIETGRTTSGEPAIERESSAQDGPDLLAQLEPALSAGSQMLPMLASALSGLTGNNNGDSTGKTAATTSAPTTTNAAAAPATVTREKPGERDSTAGTEGAGTAATTADAIAGSLSPEAQRAIKALRLLAAAYGDGNPTDPEVIELRKMLGLTPGSGGAVTGSRAQQLFQRTAATAFNNLDNQLAQYVSSLAGNHKVDRKKLTQLIREVNVALAELGPHAYTREGHAKVHQILTRALQKAHTIVSAGQSATKDMAAHVQRLTAQYLWNINGQQQPSVGGAAGSGYSPSTVGQGGSVGQWIQQAMDILRQSGTDMSKVDPAAIAIIAQYESTNNPQAINLTDSNAAKGTPSKGLMQTVDGTFRQYALPGYNDIWNPVHNIIASVRYSLDRYGSLGNVPGVKAVRAGGRYVGY
ncbi:DUF4226 domain-containing protein [Nocardia cyriacigeorgica]|uniref:DUF4226 domain-containing protein n=1 Tax=Nocardia cyriacigeorgica TaxID=135487 RepID=A0A5R8NEA5_9NOCA|nr:DUF4226 domain-containing protein [Nocardia cyriacigeorgica]TLF74022.1 DUF4226 domain-containing protein [Nocardia cyriacigeorgica]